MLLLLLGCPAAAAPVGHATIALLVATTAAAAPGLPAASPKRLREAVREVLVPVSGPVWGTQAGLRVVVVNTVVMAVGKVAANLVVEVRLGDHATVVETKRKASSAANTGGAQAGAA